MARLSNYKGPLTFQSNFEEMSKHPSSINRVDPKMQKNLVVFLGLVVSALAGALPFKFKLGGSLASNVNSPAMICHARETKNIFRLHPRFAC